MSVKTNTAKSADARSLDERYYDARTLQGLAEAERGEGYTEEEFRERFMKRMKETKPSHT